MSMAEMRWAAVHLEYRIARVHSITDDGARVTILGGIAEFATETLAALDQALEDGVRVDSLEIDLAHFTVIHETIIDLSGG
jgi:hypothetical protein